MACCVDHGCACCALTNQLYNPLCRPTCVDVDECQTGAHNCFSAEFYNNTVGGYTCSCPPGYTLDDDGYSCTDINECDIVPKKCQGTCRNTVGGYECSCSVGYRLNVTSGSCSRAECPSGMSHNTPRHRSSENINRVIFAAHTHNIPIAKRLHCLSRIAQSEWERGPVRMRRWQIWRLLLVGQRLRRRLHHLHARFPLGAWKQCHLLHSVRLNAGGGVIFLQCGVCGMYSCTYILTSTQGPFLC